MRTFKRACVSVNDYYITRIDYIPNVYKRNTRAFRLITREARTFRDRWKKSFPLSSSHQLPSPLTMITWHTAYWITGFAHRSTDRLTDRVS